MKKPLAMSKHVSLLALTLGIAVGTPAYAADPYAKPEDSWISISGTVVDPKADTFKLDYGDGVITVEMDDWDDDADAYVLLDGDRVTVYGMIDDGLFERTTIEANSVYVESLNSYFYASAADEEGDALDSAYTPLLLGDPYAHRAGCRDHSRHGQLGRCCGRGIYHRYRCAEGDRRDR